MLFRSAVALALLAICLAAGCTPAASIPESPPKHRLTQVSIINALMLGHYDGVTTIGELLGSGDFGLGTCDQLDGELIVLDGKAYKATADGKVLELPSLETTPFAVVLPFRSQAEFGIGEIGSLTELETRLNGELTNQNVFYAIRIDAELHSITIRSVARQSPPYAPLVDVVKQQTVWTHHNIRGTLVGIRSPNWTSGIGIPGYHWHFLSADRKLGGHCLDCQIERAKVSYDWCDSWLVKLDDSIGASELHADLTDEVDRVERMRTDGPTESLR